MSSRSGISFSELSGWSIPSIIPRPDDASSPASVRPWPRAFSPSNANAGFSPVAPGAAYTRATQLEWSFWDFAYRLEAWLILGIVRYEGGQRGGRPAATSNAREAHVISHSATSVN